MIFEDRKDAGARLAEVLMKYKDEDVIVFALPRGGVVLGAEIAAKLQVPLDLVITKKIGHPGNPEYAICAVGESSPPVCNQRELEHVDQKWFDAEVQRVRAEIRRRKEMYRLSGKDKMLEGKIAILVDDGIATGLTMMAAIYEIKARNPKKIIVAVPVTPLDTAQEIKELDVELAALSIEENYLGAVGAYYRHFYQVLDEEVITLLNRMDPYEPEHI